MLLLPLLVFDVDTRVCGRVCTGRLRTSGCVFIDRVRVGVIRGLRGVGLGSIRGLVGILRTTRLGLTILL
jgi:hypothetical protein